MLDRKVSHRIFAFLFIGVLLASSRTLLAEEALRVASVKDFPPYAYKTNGLIRGMDIEIMQEVCKRINRVCKIELMDWTVVQSKLRSGDLDVGFSGFKNEERKAYSYFTTSYMHKSSYRVFVKNSSNLKEAKNWEDLKGLNIAIREGQKLGKSFEQFRTTAKAKIKELPNLNKMFTTLESNEVDLIISNYQQTLFYLKNNNKLFSYKALDLIVTDSKPSFLMVSKKAKSKDPKTLALNINKTMEEIDRLGIREQINLKYLAPPKANRPIFE